MFLLSPSKRLTLSVLLLLMLSGTTQAQTTAAVVATAEGQAAAETFALPEKLTSFKQLAEFVEGVDGLEPAGSSEDEMITHQRKVARTVVAAAEQVSSQQLSNDDAMQCTYLQLQGLRILKELNEPKAGERLTKAIEAAQNDKRAEVQAVGAKFMVETGFSQWANWDEAQRTALVEKISKYITSHPPEGNHINLTMAVIDFLGDMQSEKHASNLMGKVLPHLRTSKDPKILDTLGLLEGIARRINLPGNAIELTGQMLDGSELDWASYRGKVVLVDFWATWCGPCRAEVPNILKMYQAYHDKGFEVLGISLDNSPAEAESYIEQTKIPWPTMFSGKESERGWKHPMAVRYGITGIPRAILVNREGKVVHMTARGENLERELRRLLGEPVARANPSNGATLHQVSKPVLSE